MNPDRRTAIVVGVLLIVATLVGLLSTLVTGSILSGSTILDNVAAHQAQVELWALLVFMGALSSAGIALGLYPILRRYHEGLALGAVGMRIVEAVFTTGAAVCLLVLVNLSQGLAGAGTPTPSYFQTLGNLVLAWRNSSTFVFAVVAFDLGAMMYYFIFYRARLVPQWLSAWGFVGAALGLPAALMVLFGGAPLSTLVVVLNVPIAVQEMVLAVWLIVKGFNVDSLAAVPGTTVVPKLGPATDAR
jgi:hypothetical protein